MASLFHWGKVATDYMFTFASVLNIRVLYLFQSISRIYKVSSPFRSMPLTSIDTKALSNSEALNHDQSSVIYMADQIFSHLLAIEQQKEAVIESLMSLIEQYYSWIINDKTLETGTPE